MQKHSRLMKTESQRETEEFEDVEEVSEETTGVEEDTAE